MRMNAAVGAAMMAVLAGAAQAADPGPKAGEKAPAFTLKDQNGKDVVLADVLKKGPVGVVFYRSAVW